MRRWRGAGALSVHYLGLFGPRGALLLADRLARRTRAAELLARLTWARPRPTRMSAAPPRGIDVWESPEDVRALFASRFEGALGATREAAERAGAHVFDLLGSGPIRWGDPIDWHADPTVEHQWPVRFFASYGRDLTPAGADAKVPWELNRLHHLVTLGRAWRLTGDEGYAEEAAAQFAQWCAANPWPYGVNWANPMEAAVRAVNLLWASALLEPAPPWQSLGAPGVGETLRRHAVLVEHSLEVGAGTRDVVVGNHYLAGVCGLACVGLARPDLPGAARWGRVGLRALEREIRRQVLPDGFFFESSTGYHRLACEMFLVPAVLARRLSHEVSPRYWERLERMIEVLAWLAAPDGTTPRVGDGDDGRLLPLSNGGPQSDPRPMLALGAALFARGDLKAAAGKAVEDVYWLLGPEGLATFDAIEAAASPAVSRALPDGGLHVLRGAAGADYALVRTGGPAGHSPTGHAHNDALSVEVWLDGALMIVDPGTFRYTADLAERDRFRSTRAHNTVEVDGEEINRFPPGEPFRLERDASVRVVEWRADADGASVTVDHDGYARLGVRHCRTVRYDAGSRFFEISDELAGVGEHTGCWSFHFPAGVAAVLDDGDGCVLPERGVRLSWHGAGDAEWWAAVEDTRVAPRYGVARRSKRLTLSARWHDSCTLRVAVAAVREVAGIAATPTADGTVA